MSENRKQYDRRVCERYVEKGIVKSADFNEYLKKLPDETPNAQFVQMDMHDAELGGEGSSSEDDDSAESDDLGDA